MNNHLDRTLVRRSPASWFSTVIDRGTRLQQPAVASYIRSLRQDNPSDTPAQIIERVEKRYLAAVTGSGGAVGAAAAIPGIGTVATLASLSGESLFFIEASALLALATAEIHGIPAHDNEQRKTLVLTAVLGDEGIVALAKALGTRVGPLGKDGPGKAGLTNAGIHRLNRTLLRKIAKRYAVKRGSLALGALLPAGVGAVIGGAGNRALGTTIINNTRAAFGTPPASWPVVGGGVVEGEVVIQPESGSREHP